MPKGFRGVRLALASAVLALAASSPALAQVAGVANAVKSELSGLAGAAILLGIIWIGYLVMMGRGSVQLIVTFLIGAMIVLSGGFI